MSSSNSTFNTKFLVRTAIFSAIIVIMTITPYIGYINYGLIEITTIHIAVILGAVMLGKKGGAILGAVWGITCFIRAFTNPLWVLFTNPLISVIPRIIVGFVAGLVFELSEKKLSGTVSALIAAISGTLTNTVLVLGAIYLFGDMNVIGFEAVISWLKTIWATLIGINGVIELVSAIIIVPILYNALKKGIRK